MASYNVGKHETPEITFTDAAAAKVYELIKEEENFDLKLRVYISGGGCSGFQYGFTFIEKKNPDDVVVTKTVAKEEGEEDNDGGEGDGTVEFVIDHLSLQYLEGAIVDYECDVSGERFSITNPNAKTTCGCGSSFAV